LLQGKSVPTTDNINVLIIRYWAHSALAVDPKLSVRWMATMAFIGRIISLPPPDLSTFRLPAPRGSDAVMPFRPEPPAVSTIIESILPSPLHKNHLTKGLQHSDSLVRHMTAVTLARGLQKLQVVQQLLADIDAKITTEPSSSKESSWSRVRRELEFEARRRVPDVIVIITFAQQSAQLAPTETETEEEQALAAKSTMLTESALRLFGLFYKTLPSIATEAKFDVGRLLVSSSSAKAEKKEKQSIKSGSVADDTGSIASFGTAGTAGMGGGFGYSRGEVVGFDALSQVHVLALLRDIREWDWARKAGKWSSR
jgi:nucleolar pre-ribosomal-associated protein 1